MEPIGLIVVWVYTLKSFHLSLGMGNGGQTTDFNSSSRRR